MRKVMQKKYFLLEEQYSKMVAPLLRGTKLNMAIMSLDFRPLGKTLHILHQQARDVAKLSLREHKILLCNARRARKWSPVAAHDGWGNMSMDFTHSGPDDFMIKSMEDEEEIADLQIKGGPERLATENIQLKRALGAHQYQFTKMLNMYTGTREMVKILKARDGGAVEIHCDLLQVKCKVHWS